MGVMACLTAAQVRETPKDPKESLLGVGPKSFFVGGLEGGGWCSRGGVGGEEGQGWVNAYRNENTMYRGLLVSEPKT